MSAKEIVHLSVDGVDGMGNNRPTVLWCGIERTKDTKVILAPKYATCPTCKKNRAEALPRLHEELLSYWRKKKSTLAKREKADRDISRLMSVLK